MALSASRYKTFERYHPAGMRHKVLATDSKAFYKGQLLQINLSTGKVEPATAASGATKQVCGRCEEEVTTGSSNTRKIEFKSGIFCYASGADAEAITIAHVGDLCYVIDDETVGIAGNAGANPVAGRVYDVDSFGVWVHVEYPRTPSAVGATGATGPTGPTGPTGS